MMPAGWGPLAFANAIFVDPTARMFPEALAGLSDAGMTAEVTDLSKPSGLAAINDWVNKRTAGFIPTILDEPLDSAAFVALNALRFKDDWANQFDPGNTSRQPFRLAGGGTVDVDMMSRPPTTLRLRQDDHFIAAVLAYKTPRFSMIVLTSRQIPANLADLATAASWLAGEGFDDARVILAMPKFETAVTAHLLPALDAMGLRDGESPTAFAGFSEVPLVIADVIQKTRITVNEVGTEAAAATAIVGRAGARPDHDVVALRLDRPILFAIREEASGLILLAGYVGDPSAK